MKIRTLCATALGSLLLTLGTASPSVAAALPEGYCAGAPDGNYSAPGHQDEQYVECRGGAARLQSCSPGLIFDPRSRPWGQCDWPAAVGEPVKVYPPGRPA
ncbi:carbohydrate-binding module family 14 protein [Streptomyces sp. S6]